MHPDVHPNRPTDPVASAGAGDLPAAAVAGGPVRAAHTTDQTRTPAMTTLVGGAANAVSPATGLSRLRPSELQAQVLGVLAANPVEGLNVGEIVRQLHGRTPGAVPQACDRLVEFGRATRMVSRFAVTAAGLGRTFPDADVDCVMVAMHLDVTIANASGHGGGDD